MDVNTAQALLLALRSQLGDAGIQALLGMGSQASWSQVNRPRHPPRRPIMMGTSKAMELLRIRYNPD